MGLNFLEEFLLNHYGAINIIFVAFMGAYFFYHLKNQDKKELVLLGEVSFIALLFLLLFDGYFFSRVEKNICQQLDVPLSSCSLYSNEYITLEKNGKKYIFNLNEKKPEPPKPVEKIYMGEGDEGFKQSFEKNKEQIRKMYKDL
tara:strand:+ start:403 stop:834 length:432 start_codon:yes stop_codon:yes gene_type:complete